MALVTMREVLAWAEERKVAIPAFNVDTLEIGQALLETVEAEQCPAIIAVGQAAIRDGKLRPWGRSSPTWPTTYPCPWCSIWTTARAWSRWSRPCAPDSPR